MASILLFTLVGFDGTAGEVSNKIGGHFHEVAHYLISSDGIYGVIYGSSLEGSD